jgi:hypothetical protein
VREREAGDREAGDHEDRRLCESGEVLRLAVTVLVAGVGRPHRDADGEEREQRGDEVGARVERFRDEPETAAGDARRELQRDESRRGQHRDERDPPLRVHARRLVRRA